VSTPLIDPTVTAAGYTLELGKAGVAIENEYQIEEKHREVPFYKQFLSTIGILY
jgi:hypothetical protein